MKFNKEKYKSSGRKPISSSEGRLRKKQWMADPSTFEEWVSEANPQERQPIPALTARAQPSVPTFEASIPTRSPGISASSQEIGSPASQPDRVPNLLDDAWLAIKMMEGVITPDDLARTRDIPVSRLTREIAHDLAKVLICASELGTRYVETSRDVNAESKRNGLISIRVAELETELREARAKAKAGTAELAKSENDRDTTVTEVECLKAALAAESNLKQRAEELATEMEARLEEARGQVESAKEEVVEAFKDGDDARD